MMKTAGLQLSSLKSYKHFTRCSYFKIVEMSIAREKRTRHRKGKHPIAEIWK